MACIAVSMGVKSAGTVPRGLRDTRAAAHRLLRGGCGRRQGMCRDGKTICGMGHPGAGSRRRPLLATHAQTPPSQQSPQFVQKIRARESPDHRRRSGFLHTRRTRGSAFGRRWRCDRGDRRRRRNRCGPDRRRRAEHDDDDQSCPGFVATAPCWARTAASGRTPPARRRLSSPPPPTASRGAPAARRKWGRAGSWRRAGLRHLVVADIARAHEPRPDHRRRHRCEACRRADPVLGRPGACHHLEPQRPARRSPMAAGRTCRATRTFCRAGCACAAPTTWRSTAVPAPAPRHRPQRTPACAGFQEYGPASGAGHQHLQQDRRRADARAGDRWPRRSRAARRSCGRIFRVGASFLPNNTWTVNGSIAGTGFTGTIDGPNVTGNLEAGLQFYEVKGWK